LKMASRRIVCATFCTKVFVFGLISSTVARKIGAKMRPRLNVRRQDGGWTPRPRPRGWLRTSLSERFLGFASASSASTSLPSESTYTISYSCRFSFSRRRRCLRVAILRLCRPLECHRPALDDRGDDVSAEVVGEVAPIAAAAHAHVNPL